MVGSAARGGTHMFSLRLRSKRKGRSTQVIDFDEKALTDLSVREAMALLAERSRQQQSEKKKPPYPNEEAAHC